MIPRFTTERDARLWLEEHLGTHCRLVPEVHLRHRASGELLRIDYLGVFRTFRREAVVPTLVGFEVKRYFDDFRDWTSALKQGIDYRHCVVEDRRSQVYSGTTPSFIFVFPDLRDLSADSRADWAAGAERLAGKFNVGTVRLCPYGGIALVCAATQLWTTRYGPCGVQLFGTGRRTGAA